MADNKIKAPLIPLFLFSIIAGVALSAWYEPVYQYAVGFIKNNIPAAEGLEKEAALAAAGIFYIGAVIFGFSIFILGVFSRKVLFTLAGQLKKKQVLSPRFKLKKTGVFSGNFRDITEVLGHFILLFEKLKQERDKFHKIIVTHLDPALIRNVEDRGINEMYLGGKKREATIFFSDIRGFTSFTEKHRPDETIMVLNEYFSTTTEIINKNEGNVNKYIGDAVLAVFEEPPEYRNYSATDKAVTAGMDIQVRFELLIKKWKKEIDPALNIGLGIGIAKGRVIAGTIGSEKRMEYTVIGDAVNFASRLCSLAAAGEVIIGEDTYNAVEDVVEVDQLPPVKVKGKTGTHNIFRVRTRRMLR